LLDYTEGTEVKALRSTGTITSSGVSGYYEDKNVSSRRFTKDSSQYNSFYNRSSKESYEHARGLPAPNSTAQIKEFQELAKKSLFEGKRDSNTTPLVMRSSNEQPKYSPDLKQDKRNNRISNELKKLD
jgi:hypothetical protein